MTFEERPVALSGATGPTNDTLPPDTALIRCVGGCLRIVSRDVKLCLHCRNTSNHPVFGRGLKQPPDVR